MADGMDRDSAFADMPDDVETLKRRLEELVALTRKQRDDIDAQLTWLALSACDAAIELWTLDLATREFKIRFMDAAGTIQTRSFPTMPDAAIERGYVHPSSVQAMRDLVRDILDGREQGTANLLLRTHGDEDFSWCSVSWRMQRDELGRPVRALGVRHPLTGTRQLFQWRESVPDTLYPHLLRVGIIDLSTMQVETLFNRNGRQTGMFGGMTLDEVLAAGASMPFSPHDDVAWRQLLDGDALRARYEGGRRWSVGMLHMLDSTGKAHPVRLAINLKRDALGTTIARTYLSSCDERAAWEADAELSVMRDEDTMLYRRDSALRVAAAALQARRGTGLSATVVIRLVGDAHAPAADIACALGVMLDTDAVAFRLDPHTVAAFLPAVDSADALQARLASTVAATRESLADASTGPDALAGAHLVATSVIGSTTTFVPAEAISRAFDAALAVDASQKDRIEQPLPFDPARESGAADAEARRPDLADLAADDLACYARIATDMLEAGPPLQAIRAALRGVGVHHRARRAYVVTVAREGGLLTVLFEWLAPGTASIQDAFSNRPVSRFPFIKHNIAAARPVLAEHRSSLPHVVNSQTREQEMWRYALVPISTTADRSMALCIDSPTEHLDDWTLASCVADRIQHEWDLIAHGQHRSEGTSLEEVVSLPGAAELEQALGTARAEAWSSVGAMSVSIPHVAGLVERHGFSHVLAIFLKISAALDRSFSGASVFRTADTEFVVIAPNLSYHSFVQRSARVRTELAGSFPGEVQVGHAWSDSTREAWSVVEEARTVSRNDTMRSLAHLERKPELSIRPREIAPNVSPLASSATMAERFTLYLQPKIDIPTGKVVGAEVLARVIGPDGRIEAPALEIKRLEDAGSISELDYFIFDRMLALMDDWRERGLDIVPMSSNFSRSTLASTTSLASVLAIMSRYPDIPSRMVEMEVTESAIDLGRATLSELVGRYRSLGLRVALDDFGSHYSNVSALANVHFDTIKLDRSVVMGLPGNEVSSAVVRNIAEICASQRMDCIAEGVESPEQADAIMAQGCTVCQGYYFDKPMPADLFERKYLVPRTR